MAAHCAAWFILKSRLSLKEKISRASVNATPGSFDDDSIVRGAVAEAIRKSPKSREVIAEEISELTGRTVTLQMVNGWTGESQQSHSFPFRLLRAFCHVTGDCTPIHAVLERAGLLVINAWEKEALELGLQTIAHDLSKQQLDALRAKVVAERTRA
jgi:hypothetical protein